MTEPRRVSLAKQNGVIKKLSLSSYNIEFITFSFTLSLNLLCMWVWFSLYLEIIESGSYTIEIQLHLKYFPVDSNRNIYGSFFSLLSHWMSNNTFTIQLMRFNFYRCHQFSATHYFVRPSIILSNGVHSQFCMQTQTLRTSVDSVPEWRILPQRIPLCVCKLYNRISFRPHFGL